ncbi:unnamed protein product [Fraxinus pennsylvanica]|uniref:Tify domain-containing protein n=1 Tax=Fraxinus pennsylvanica TaxID=56036 RepID=A0AAD1Z7U2_9LAMI|nr:unnamed protein product [Fraxinus pennsylvanica]
MKTRSYGEDCMIMPVQVHDNRGGFQAGGISGGDEEKMSSSEEMLAPMASELTASRTSELTVSFEGEVHVFPAVTPEKNNKAVDDGLSPTVSSRIASLVRFLEKRKERCFEKKIRYTY